MKLSPENYPDPIPSDYGTHAVNEPIDIYTGPCEFRGTEVSNGTCTIAYEWFPLPRICVRACGIDSFTMFGKVVSGDVNEKLYLPDYCGGVEVPIEFRRFGKNASGDTEVVAHIDALNSGATAPLAELRFHLANGPDFLGDITADAKNMSRTRASLIADGWKLDIDRLTAKEIREGLAQHGGYAITHVCSLARENSKSFTADDATDFLALFYQYMAFCRGGWCTCLLQQGRNAAGEVVHTQHKLQRVSKAPRNPTWLTDRIGSPLSEVFPGFSKKWKAEEWKNSIELAVYWLVASNQCEGGIEGALVLAFAALESLSWVACVEDGRLLSTEGFEKLSAADKIRLLLRNQRIPIEIPAKLAALRAIEKGDSNVRCGPDVLAYIRNCYVHSTPKNEKKLKNLSGDYHHEAWELAMQHLELTLLSLFHYQGQYSSRIDRSGKIPTVPWAASAGR